MSRASGARTRAIACVLALVVDASLTVACTSDDDGGESSSGTATLTGTTTVASASSDDGDPTGPCGTCVAKYEAFVGAAADPPMLCSVELVAWSNLELCLIDCDTRFPAPDDAGFCECVAADCDAQVDACGAGSEQVCNPAGGTSSGG